MQLAAGVYAFIAPESKTPFVSGNSLVVIGDGYRCDVYSRNWSRYRVALERPWQPYLDGKAPMGQAVAGLVRDAVP